MCWLDEINWIVAFCFYLDSIRCFLDDCFRRLLVNVRFYKRFFVEKRIDLWKSSHYFRGLVDCQVFFKNNV